MNTPPTLKYTKNDEWINEEGTIGISDYAQDQLSDIVYVEFAVETGETINKGDTIGTIESVKAAADVYAPASGKISTINKTLADMPETINSAPYGEAWLIKLELSNPAELDELMDASAYEKYCAERS